MIKDKDKKKKKLSSSGMTTKDKMLARKKQLESNMDMCNFRDFIEQRGIEQGLLQG